MREIPHSTILLAHDTTLVSPVTDTTFVTSTLDSDLESPTFTNSYVENKENDLVSKN